MAMEEALLAECKDKKWIKTTWSGFVAELTKVSFIAAPMVVVSLSQYLLQVVSVMMAGHLGELSLSGVAIANSFTAVTGFSLLFGMAGALETLCGQAYGAEQYQKLGIYTYCSVVSLTLVCLPVSLLWIFVEKILEFIGQDPLISHEAGKYSILLIPALLAYAMLQSLVRYFQTQGLTLPMLFSSCATLCFHIPVCWILVYKLELGTTGAALSIGFSYWLNVLFLVIYIKYSSACEKTRVSFSIDVLLRIREFFQFGVPSAVMACTRVSNELGAGNPRAVQAAVVAAVVLAVAEAISVSTILFCCRSVLGYVYSNEKEVVDYVAEITPLLSLSVIMDSLQAVLSGIARGSGWQHLGAYVNLGAYYLVGIPLAVLLCFVLHLRGVGLWIGILGGSTVQALLLALTTAFTNWQKQANEARERIFEQTGAAERG